METIDAALYARTSTQIQQSCETQLQLTRKLADERGWRTAFRLKDEAWKGQNAERPGYQRLLELVEEERVQVVAVWKLDRLFRSLKEASAAQDLFQNHKVAIVSYTEPFDTTTSIGRFVFGFLANVAQFETDLIKERAQLGYERRVREGKWTGAHVPFGYARAADGKLEVCQDEAKVIRRMHGQYFRSRGDLQLARWLNARGMLYRGKPWNADRVRRALTNPICVGKLTTRGVTARHEDLAILSQRRFRRTCQQRRGLRHLGTHQGEREASIDRIMAAYLAELDRESPQEPPQSSTCARVSPALDHVSAAGRAF